MPVEVDTGTVSTRMMRIINPFQQFAAQQGAIELCIAVHQARANPSVLEAFCRLFVKVSVKQKMFFLFCWKNRLTRLNEEHWVVSIYLTIFRWGFHFSFYPIVPMYKEKEFMWHRRRCDCAYTKIPRHVAVNVATRTWRDISTNVSRPRHVRVEVNLTLLFRENASKFL